MSSSSFKIEFDMESLLPKTSSSEIPISLITSPFESKLKLPIETETPDTFTVKETTTGEESVSIFYKQGTQNMFISIYGPREMKFREKIKAEYSKIELYIKYSMELPKEMDELICKQIKKFVKKIILRNSYPKCQISININIFNSSVNVDKFSLFPKICNGLMIALCLSGINLNMLCFSKGFLRPQNQRCMVFMEVESDFPSKKEGNLEGGEEIVDIETEEAFDMEFYNNCVDKCKKSFQVMNKKLKNIIYKKLTQTQ